MSKRKPKVGDYAFWPYDQYPGLLGGVIGYHEKSGWTTRPSINSEGHCYIESFQQYFRPKFTLPPAEGAKLMAEITRLGVIKYKVDIEVRHHLGSAKAKAFAGLVPDEC